MRVLRFASVAVCITALTASTAGADALTKKQRKKIRRELRRLGC